MQVDELMKSCAYKEEIEAPKVEFEYVDHEANEDEEILQEGITKVNENPNVMKPHNSKVDQDATIPESINADKNPEQERNPNKLSKSKLDEFIISNFPVITPEKGFSWLNDDVFEPDVPDFLGKLEDKHGIYKKYGNQYVTPFL